MSIFLNRLKKFRNDKNMIQKQIAEFLDITERQYRRYEAGQIDLPLSKAIKLADFFNVSLDYLVGRSDEESFIISPKYQSSLSDEANSQK